MSSRFCAAVLGSAAIVLLANVAGAAGTPEQRCQAAKSMAAGKFAACRQDGEAKLAASGDVTTYTAALGTCAVKFSVAWQKATDKATRAGATCLDDPRTANDFELAIVEHSNNVATALAGGGLAGDTCNGVVLKTGQVAFYGPDSDGNRLRGAARSYTDNGDGTITDNTTGLTWEKKSDDGSIHDKDYSASWGMTSSPYTMNGGIVTTFLAALNAGSGFAGYTDWRIPNVNELRSLTNYQSSVPAVSTAFNRDCIAGCTVTTCSCTQAGLHWSSTTGRYLSEQHVAWGVGFHDGAVFANTKSNAYHVRAVRGGS